MIRVVALVGLLGLVTLVALARRVALVALIGRVALVALVGSVALVGLVALARIGDCWKIERLFGCLAFHLSQPFPSMQLVASDASTATAIVDVRRHVWLLVLCLHLAHRCFVITGERESGCCESFQQAGSTIVYHILLVHGKQGRIIGSSSIQNPEEERGTEVRH